MLGTGAGLPTRSSATSITGLFDEQVRNFDEAFRQLGYTKEMIAGVVGDDQTDDLSKLYSMESERKLHREAFGGGLSAVESTATQNQKESGFGDDVELF